MAIGGIDFTDPAFGRSLQNHFWNRKNSWTSYAEPAEFILVHSGRPLLRHRIQRWPLGHFQIGHPARNLHAQTHWIWLVALRLHLARWRRQCWGWQMHGKRISWAWKQTERATERANADFEFHTAKRSLYLRLLASGQCVLQWMVQAVALPTAKRHKRQ